MDFSSVGFSASQLQGLPAAWSPWFDVAHFLLSALAVRKEVGKPFSRSNPLATWVATLTASFAGSMVANPLLGKPVFDSLSNEYNLYLASAIWWAVFYSPGDVVYTLTTSQAVYVPVCVVKEIYRAKKIVGGISDASKKYPDHEIIQVAVGLIKGNGSGFIKPITRLVTGKWAPGSSEILKMSVTSKECLVAAVLLVAHAAGYVPLALDLLYLGIVSTFLVVKLTSLLADPIDPFKPLDEAVNLLTGGLWENAENLKQE